MAESVAQRVRHSVTVKAPAEAVFALIADVERWPYVFPPTVHAERLELTGSDERIRLWALANGEVKTWTSRRNLDRDRLSVRFRQEITQPPVAAMGGEWVLEPRSERETLVVLHHDYRAVGDDPEGLRWIRQAVDRNSRAELDRLRGAAELDGGIEELTLSFDDSVRIRGAIGDVYAFLADAARWPERLPHVARLELREDVAGIQEMEMDTRTADGTTHTTRSVRVCFPEHRIVYKQTVVPAAMAGHTGEWLLREQPDGTVLATSRHVVLVDRAGVAKVLGDQATVDEAKTIIRTALGKNSRTTLEHARTYAEERAHG
ncbi:MULTISPECIES: aromatase/cyclase [unclassified Streptomyces]|uniref:aromatase/cyclase n=1 Tax=unclassified Streptomyces TaxID=2593676 RepID=UPI0036D00561